MQEVIDEGPIFESERLNDKNEENLDQRAKSTKMECPQKSYLKNLL